MTGKPARKLNTPILSFLAEQEQRERGGTNLMPPRSAPALEAGGHPVDEVVVPVVIGGAFS
jgi:hypothetical protein